MTRLEFLSYVKREFKRTDKDTEIYEALNDTLYEMTTLETFEIIQSESAISLLDDTGSYAFPVTFSMTIGKIIYEDDQGHGIRLAKLSKDQFDNKYQNYNTTDFSHSEPIDYTIYGDNILIAPYEETGITTEKIRVFGATLATKLTGDNDTPQFQDRWREVIKRGVLWRVYNGIGNITKSDRNLLLFQAGLQRMKDIDNDKKSGVETVAYQGV